MWVKEVTQAVYASKEELAEDVVGICKAKPYLEQMHDQQFVLEYATPRAGELASLLSSAQIYQQKELGLGGVNPRTTAKQKLIALAQAATCSRHEYMPNTATSE